MVAAIGAMVDRRVGLMIMSRVRRRWPLMRLVPATMMMPLLAPAVRRARRSVVLLATVGVVAASVAVTAVLAAGWA
jgi:hypothetical protein